NERGIRNAPLMAAKFLQRKEKVDQLISSDAKRAQETAGYFATALGLRTEEILKEGRIYEATVPSLLALINAFPTTVDRVMMFGHNPGFSNLIDHLTGDSLGDLPTCGIARLDLFVSDWRHVIKGTAHLAWLDFPKRYEPAR
nr:histidine phosphatase family protein [Bacteroidota bacterium]